MADFHRWIDQDGTAWGCAAYDHGPFCRRCQRLNLDDEMTVAVLENVDAGLVDVEASADGTLRFRLTAVGDARAVLLTEDFA